MSHGPYQRVALINVRVESRQRIPVGLLTLAACIKDRAETQVFDPDPEENPAAAVAAFRPDLVGIGFMTQTAFRANQIHDALRVVLPDVPVIVGGVGPTVDPENVFQRFQPAALVIGEGEKPLMRLVAGESWQTIPGVYLGPGRPFQPGERFDNLDDLPLPAYECMPDFRKYLCPPGGIRGRWYDRGTPMIMTGRGCPYRCVFCSSHQMFGRRVRRRSVGHVLREVRRLHDEYGADSVYFFDDTFNAPPSWTREFCAALRQEPYRMEWGCQVRVNLMDPYLARIMKEAGCVQVDIGVESGSPKVLKALKKDETVEQTIRAFDACHQAGLAPMGTFLVGCPEETQEDVELTRRLIRRIKPAFSEFFYLIPYPGDDLYRQAVEKGWIKDFSYEGRGMVDRPVMEINFSLEEQREIRRRYARLTAWRNLSGYMTWPVFRSFLRSLRWALLAAAWREFRKTWNIRDAMQAYAHALRKSWSGRAGA